MRERLVAALVGTVVVVVAVMGAVRAYATAGEIERSAQATVERSLTMAGVAVDERLHGGRPVTSDFLDALSGDVVGLRYRPRQGAAVTGGLAVADSDREYAASATRPDGAELTAVRPADDIGRRISDALLPLVLLALGLIAAAAVAGWLLARHIARPFQQLADAARGLARGRAGVAVPHYGVAEADAIGTALREGLSRLDRLQEREEQFAVTASHELRTPITALRLRVEGLALDPDLPPAARTDVDELGRGLDRLSTAVVDVLDAAPSRRDRVVPAVPAEPLVAEAVQRVSPWRARRRVRPDVDGGVQVGVPADAFTDAVTALVEDCARAGRGSVGVGLVDRGSHLELTVTDEGPRRGEPDLLHADTAPPPLASVVSTVESFGGRLFVTDAATHGYRLLLPRGAA
ncbi:sensor histidine kinase [Intrasporangium flavum]|uniref:sensor histidine kinase n=1 Tax=Intrasporangium flavum TaxID=1428657 RepID=UPI00096DE06C|nr:HAMP domain-containing sensor histidine kinase [Intrasporangium flavum]